MGHALLAPSFYQDSDVTHVAKALIGKVLSTRIDGHLTEGIIQEVEAYCGKSDRACHAYNYKRTKRTEAMFLAGGHTYVYLCYGIHPLLNIVTGSENEPDAVLIRGIIPITGQETILTRRGKTSWSPDIAFGPGRAAKALGINLTHNALPLNQAPIWIEEHANSPPFTITTSKRIGIDYAGPDADLLWRFTYVPL